MKACQLSLPINNKKLRPCLHVAKDQLMTLESLSVPFQLSNLLRFSQTCELESSKAAFTITFFAAVNHNYDHKQRTLKHRNTETHKTDRNPPITNQKPWPFEPAKVKFCFLRGPLSWLTAAKSVIVSWLLNFRIRMFVKSAVTIVHLSILLL